MAGYSALALEIDPDTLEPLPGPLAQDSSETGPRLPGLRYATGD